MKRPKGGGVSNWSERHPATPLQLPPFVCGCQQRLRKMMMMFSIPYQTYTPEQASLLCPLFSTVAKQGHLIFPACESSLLLKAFKESSEPGCLLLSPPPAN